MARYTCPSCGAAFNGRKCRNCCYEHFTEEISHGLHTHKGEPLVIDAPVRRRIPRKDPFDCDKRRKGIPKWLRTILLWILVVNLLPMGIEWIQDGIDRAKVPAPEPEPVLSSLAVKLWEGEEITIWAEPQKGNPMQIPVLVENNSQDDVTVSDQHILLGDFQTTYTHLYVEAGKESWGRGYLYLDKEDLQYSGPGPFEEIRLDLEIYDSDSYETLYETEGIVVPLTQSVDGMPELEGLLLVDDEAVCIRFLGWQGDSEQWIFSFLVENRTESAVNLWAEDAGIDGETADVSLWEEIQPGCRAVARAYWYPEVHPSPEELELTLHISIGETDERTEMLTIPLR